MSDQTERVLTALEESTRCTTEAMGKIEGLGREVIALKDNQGERLMDLDQQMGTMNAHLDNLVRELGITNQLLRDDMEERVAERQRQQTLEDETRLRKQQLEDDNRALVKNVGSQAWEIFKQPMGYLVAGVIGWLLFQYFYVPPVP